LRRSDGGTGFASLHSPARGPLAHSSSRAYSSRSCGVCSFAYSRYHHAVPARSLKGLLRARSRDNSGVDGALRRARGQRLDFAGGVDLAFGEADGADQLGACHACR
jgi:hypothetical protein